MVDDVTTTGASWAAFVRAGARASATLEAGLDRIGIDAADTPAARPHLLALAGEAAALAAQSLNQGAQHAGRLARACARCLELMVQGEVPVVLGYPLLASSLHTLRQAFDSAGLGGADALMNPLPLRAARYELETLFPGPAGAGAATATALARPDVPVDALLRRRDGA